MDLARAARNAVACDLFDADFCLLQPWIVSAETATCSWRWRIAAANLPRGCCNHAALKRAPTANIPEGDGFLMRHGWTVAWCGWQWDVVQSPALMGLNPPDGARRTVSRSWAMSWLNFSQTSDLTHKLLANRVHHPYRADDVRRFCRRMMTVRDWPGENAPRFLGTGGDLRARSGGRSSPTTGMSGSRADSSQAKSMR